MFLRVVRGLFLSILFLLCADALRVMSTPQPKGHRPAPNPAYKAKFQREKEILQQAEDAWYGKHDTRTAKIKFKELLSGEQFFVDDALISLARIADAEGDHKAALKYYDALLGDHPHWRSSLENEPGVVGRYAELCEEQGPSADALAAYHKLLRLAAWQHISSSVDPNVPITSDIHDPLETRMRASLVLGLLHGSSLRVWNTRNHAALEKPLAYYRKAIRLEPDSALAHFYLGAALKTQGRTEEADAEFANAEKFGDAAFRIAMHKRENDFKAMQAEGARKTEIIQRRNRIIQASRNDPNLISRAWMFPPRSN